MLRGAAKRLLTTNPSRAAYKFVLRDLEQLLELPHAAQVLETKRFNQLVRPLLLDKPEAKRVVVLAPHPDDDIFGAGGTLLKLAEAGAAIRTVYLSSAKEPDVIHAVKREAETVCKMLGAEPVFLHLPMGAFGLDDTTVGSVRAAVTDFRPDVVFVTFLLDDHDDHRRANHLLLRAFPQGELLAEIWAYQIYSTVIPNVVVDITAHAERKRQLIGIWQSVSGDRDWGHYVLGMNAANCRYLPGRAPIYAETFFVVPAKEYLGLCERYFAAPQEAIYRRPGYRS